MNRRQGYYGVIQYLPEPDLMEGANVGVYLLCEDTGKLRVMMSQTNARIRKHFGQSAYEERLLSADKEALRDRLESAHLKSVSDLMDFVASEAGHLVLSAPRSIAVTDAEADLRQLYATFLPGSNVERKPKHIVPPDISVYFEPLFLHAPIQKDVPVDIPKLNKRIVAPYAYLNRAMNYIVPRGFSGDTRGAIQAAEHLGVQGLMLSKHQTIINGESFEQKLVVVAGFEKPEVQGAVLGFLSAFPIRAIAANDVEKFAGEVREHARQLPGERRSTR